MPLLSRGRWIRGVMPLPLSARGRGILLAFAAPVLRAGSAAVPPFGAYSAPSLVLAALHAPAPQMTLDLLYKLLRSTKTMRLRECMSVTGPQEVMTTRLTSTET